MPHPTDKNYVVVLVGSNIEPAINIASALDLLSPRLEFLQLSRTWETEAIGSNAANFLNIAFSAYTHLPAAELKETILLPTETRLGRRRSQDKNAPRTMDLDIILFNHNVLDEDLWKKAFIALPVADIEPELCLPKNQMKLVDAARRLQKGTFAVVREDITFRI